MINEKLDALKQLQITLGVTFSLALALFRGQWGHDIFGDGYTSGHP